MAFVSLERVRVIVVSERVWWERGVVDERVWWVRAGVHARGLTATWVMKGTERVGGHFSV